MLHVSITLSEGEFQGLEVAAVGAGHYVEFSGFYDIVKVGVVIFEVVRSDFEVYFAALSGFQGDSLEILELLDGK